MCKRTIDFSPKNLNSRWTPKSVELNVEHEGKKCSRCQKFKSAQAFYKQGNRLESLCKDCKREARGSRSRAPIPSAEIFPQENSFAEKPQNQVPKSYEDLGFTEEEFLEIVEFYKELIRLDKKGR